MLSILALIAVVLAPQVAASTGRIVDSGTGRPIAGAEVTIVGARGSAKTDSDGRFTWPDLPPPPIIVVVILQDGRAARPVRLATVNLAAEVRIDVEIGWSQALTVRGAAPDIQVAPGASVVSVTASDIETRQPITLAQTIEHVPGVGTISEGQGATPAIRGLARGRTLILVDGGRVSTERGAGANASFLDPAMLARVDVARGPGSVAYGTDAFGGVIAARMRQPDFTTPLAARLSATLGAGVPERRADVELAHGYGGGGVLVGARVRAFDDYRSPERVVPHSGWSDAGARLQWAQTSGASRWSVGWRSDAGAKIGRPRSDSDAIVATTPFERSHRLTVSFERPALGAWRDVRVHAFVSASEERTEQDRLAAPGRPRRLDRADTEARDMQIRVTGRRAVGRLRVHTGIDAQGRFGLKTTDEAFLYNAGGALTSTVVTQSIVSAHRTAIGVFAEAEAPLRSWLRLSGGLRGDAIHGANRGGFFGDRSITHQAVAAVGSVTVAPARDLTVTAQVARGFRDPTLTDRFSRGPVGRGFIEGNPNLVPETSRQFDVTARYDAGRLQLGGAFYWYDIANLVERYSAGPDLFRVRNRGRARLAGAEADARVDVGLGLAIDLIAQVSQGRDAVDDMPLNDVAPRSVGVIARHVWRERLSSYLRVAVVSAHERAGPGEVATPGYTIVDAAAAWRLTPAIELRATIRNALGASYYASAGPRWVWAPGRQGAVTIVIARPDRR